MVQLDAAEAVAMQVRAQEGMSATMAAMSWAVAVAARAARRAVVMRIFGGLGWGWVQLWGGRWW